MSASEGVRPNDGEKASMIGRSLASMPGDPRFGDPKKRRRPEAAPKRGELPEDHSCRVNCVLVSCEPRLSTVEPKKKPLPCVTVTPIEPLVGRLETPRKSVAFA